MGHSVHFLSRGVVAVIAGKGGDSFRVAELSVGDLPRYDMVDHLELGLANSRSM